MRWGRSTIYSGIAFAVIGFISAIYALSWGPIPNLPTPILILMCPAALLAAMAPSSEPDTDFMWMVAILNAILYAAVGIVLAHLFHVDDDEG